jgi:hypothetical protein
MLGVCSLDVWFKRFKDHVYAINILHIRVITEVTDTLIVGYKIPE